MQFWQGVGRKAVFFVFFKIHGSKKEEYIFLLFPLSKRSKYLKGFFAKMTCSDSFEP